MSIKTTHYVTREFAIKAIKIKMITDEDRIEQYIDEYFEGKSLKKCSDDELECILEEALHDGFKNFSIVSEEEFEKNKNIPDEYLKNIGIWYNPRTPYLDDLNYLPEYNNAY